MKRLTLPRRIGTIGTKECCCGEFGNKDFVLKAHCYHHKTDECFLAAVHFNAVRGRYSMAFKEAVLATKLIAKKYRIAVIRRGDKSLTI